MAKIILDGEQSFYYVAERLLKELYKQGLIIHENTDEALSDWDYLKCKYLIIEAVEV